MDTTSTSSNILSSSFMLIYSCETQNEMKIGLHSKIPWDIQDRILGHIAVYNNKSYKIYLCVPNENEEQRDFKIDINGFPLEFNGSKNQGTKIYSEGICYVKYRLNGPEKPFNLLYGFAQFKVSCVQNHEEQIAYSKYFSCFVGNGFDCKGIEKMINTLTEDYDQEIMNLMFHYQDETSDRYTVIQSDTVKNTPQSLTTALNTIMQILKTYEKNIAYFQVNALSNITQKPEKLSTHQLRQMTHKEVIWLGRHPEVLTEVPVATTIKYNQKHYYPHHVESNVSYKTYENYENTLILTFLNEIIQTLQGVMLDLSKGVNNNLELIKKINPSCGDDYAFPVITVLESCTDHVTLINENVKKLLKIATKLRQRYATVLRGVKHQYKLPNKIVRTKPFEEIRAYSEIFHLIELWKKHGDFNLNREEFFLQIYSVDKIYEYYVLYELLYSLKKFISSSSDYNCVIDSKLNDKQDDSYNMSLINNVYVLRNSNFLIKLHYQPKFFSDETEKNGVTIHRLSNAYYFNEKTTFATYYTPDYLLTVKDLSTNTVVNHVFDAKYRNLQENGSSYVDGVFKEAYFKYKCDVASKDSSDPIDTVWLLYGRGTYRGLHFAFGSSWAQKFYKDKNSGVTLVSPYSNSLDSLIGYLIDVPEKESKNKSELSLDENSNFVEKEPIVKEKEAVPDKKVSDTTKKQQKKDDVVAKILTLHKLMPQKANLHNVRWCNLNLKLNNPLITKKKPSRTLRKRYTKVDLKEDELYLYTGLQPHQIQLLTNIIKRCSK